MTNPDLSLAERAALIDRALAAFGLKSQVELDARMGWPRGYAAKLRHVERLYPAYRRCAEELDAALDVAASLPSAQLHLDGDAPVVTIDWRSFVREGVAQDGARRRGVSLRALVEAGLYTSWRRACGALDNFDILSKLSSSDVISGGQADVLFSTLRDAQRFCVHARTAVGAQIVEVILDHHDEMQLLLDGDPGAHARLERVRAVPSAPTAASMPSDPILAQLALMGELRRSQLAQEERLRDAEGQLAAVDARSLDLVRRFDGLTQAVTAPAPPAPAPERTQRQELRALVEGAARARGLAYEDAWRALYAEHRLRHGVDLRTRAKAARAASTLAYADEQGHVEALYALAWAMWGPRQPQ